MAGLSEHARDRLLAELQSGTMTSGAASISVGPLPAGYVRFDNWPTSPTPVYGMLTDPATGQSWRIRLNQVTKQWEIVDDPIPTPADLLSTPEIRERFEQTSAALRRAQREGDQELTVAIKLWVLRSIDQGTTFETVDTSINPPNIEMLFDERTGILRNTIYRPALFAVPPGQFRVLTEVGQPCSGWKRAATPDQLRLALHGVVESMNHHAKEGFDICVRLSTKESFQGYGAVGNDHFVKILQELIRLDRLVHDLEFIQARLNQ